jgi:hypothetical protein
MGILCDFAHCSARLSAPVAPPDIISEISDAYSVNIELKYSKFVKLLLPIIASFIV